MTSDRWNLAEALFARAKEVAREQREAFVRREAGADGELAAEVLRLLARDPETRFLESPVARVELPHRLGDFELIEELGRGGMGVVYRARQLSLGRTVAVKVLPPSLTLNARQIDRFQREARAVARLDHPHIVTVLTVDQVGETRFFAMELVSGHNLAEELERLRRDAAADQRAPAGARDRLPSSRADDYLRAVAELVRQVADGLSHAHEHGVVHRDVKPSNLLLDGRGQVRIVDFGLARDEQLGSLTRTGELAGTPHYMSPEQASSGRKKQVDHRTDVYSLGVVLFELLTLRRPFEGDSERAVLDEIVEREAPRIRALNPRVPRDLETICGQAMAKEPERRYATAAALRDDLARFLSGQAIHAHPPSTPERAARWLRRHRLPLGVAGALLLATVGGVIGRDVYARDERADELLALLRDNSDGLREALPQLMFELRAARAELEQSKAVKASGADILTGFDRALDELRAELRGQGLRDLEASRDTGRPPAARESLRLSALRRLTYAAALFPEDTVLQDKASMVSLSPTVQVRALDENGAETGATVYLREIDAVAAMVAARFELGRTPLPPTPVLPGEYRLVVVFDAGGFRELAISPGVIVLQNEFVLQRRADEGAIANDMEAIAGGPFTFPEHRLNSHSGLTVTLEPFLMDRTEVSNGEYRRFLEAHPGRELPYFWREYGLDPQYDDRPVVGMSYSDAQAYALWRGKRLPTEAEWLRAARGAENRPFPYSSDPAAPPRGNVGGPFPYDGKSGEDFWNNYLAHSMDVRSAPEARSPEALFHLYGNVDEFTESLPCDSIEGLLIPRASDRVHYGGAWNAGESNLRAPGYEGISDGHGLVTLGFRCAKNVAP